MGPNYTPDPELEERIAEEEREAFRHRATSAEWERMWALHQPDENERRFVERFHNEAPRCEVCQRPMVCGARARRHQTCAPTCERCWRPTTNCQCSATVKAKANAAS